MRTFIGTLLGFLLALLVFFQGPAMASAPVQVTHDPSNQGRPDVNGGTIVWKDLRAGNWDIYRYDIGSGDESVVAENPAYQNLPITNGLLVLWQDNRSGKNDIYMKDLVLGIEQPLVTGSGNQGIPDISGNTLVYIDDSSGDNDVLAMDLTTRTVIPVVSDSSDQWQPRISGSHIVWQDNRNGKWDIYTYDLDDPVPGGEPLVAGPGEHAVCDIDGDRVVWQEHTGGQYDIHLKDLQTGAEQAITADAAYQASPRISGDLVVWEDYRNDPNPSDTYYDYDIYMYDLTSGQESQLAGGHPIQARPAVDGETVVWEDTTAGNYDVWMETVPDTTPPVISPQAPAPGASGICPAPAVSASLSDNRTGIDTATLLITLDGADVTASAAVSESSVSYQAEALSDGLHTVSVTAADNAGNADTVSWQFSTSAPQLSIAGEVPYWASYYDYAAGILTVDFIFQNSPDASEALAIQALASPATNDVTAVDLPTDPVDIPAGGQGHIPVRYQIPPGVASFRITVYIGCHDPCGGQYYLPGPPPGA